MLDLTRYLLGVLEIALLAGFATLGGSAVRARLLPVFSGAPAHLATAVIALAILVWIAELLGTVGLFEPLPYLVGVALAGVGLWAIAGRGQAKRMPVAVADQREIGEARFSALAGIAIGILAVLKFIPGVRDGLGGGMTGFDSTWYHAPFSAGFLQSGDTWDLHFIAPQFLAWFYPANAEVFHGVGMLAFDRDVLSPLLNLGWFAGSLFALWCIGRSYKLALPSVLSLLVLLVGAWILRAPLLADQAGEARNDIVGIFFLLSAVAIALNAWAARAEGERGLASGALIVVGLAAGLAAGTKLNFLLPAVVLVLGLALVAPAGDRLRALAAAGLAAFAGGGYWYLRNLAHSGNPLPWFDSLGPISLPAPDQALGGREGHSVFGYLADGSVWSDWFLPGLHDGLTAFWPAYVVLAASGLVLCLGRRSGPVLRVAAAVGIAAGVAWLIAPTSASGPEGMPRGFESGLRYLAPALLLGIALLPLAPPLRDRIGRWAAQARAKREEGDGEGVLRSLEDALARVRSAWFVAAAIGLACACVALGYPVQRHYLENRYANPGFAEGGLNAAFKWATPLSGARIATMSTRQYPLYGTDLSNHVQYIGEEQRHGGFTAPTNCRQWRRTLNVGHYDYVVTSRDRIEEGKPSYPDSTRWTEGLGVEEILREPPTVVFKLKGPLDPAACRR